uniref:Uncharacterized protein n=2 Tax=Oryza TaxID=4527 RepID=A0A0E0H3G8_ORYNI
SAPRPAPARSRPSIAGSDAPPRAGLRFNYIYFYLSSLVPSRLASSASDVDASSPLSLPPPSIISPPSFSPQRYGIRDLPIVANPPRLPIAATPAPRRLPVSCSSLGSGRLGPTAAFAPARDWCCVCSQGSS